MNRAGQVEIAVRVGRVVHELIESGAPSADIAAAMQLGVRQVQRLDVIGRRAPRDGLKQFSTMTQLEQYCETTASVGCSPIGQNGQGVQSQITASRV